MVCSAAVILNSNFISAPAWSMLLSGWKTANERQTAITSWFIAISAVLLVLYLTEPKPDSEKQWYDYYFEAIAVILLIVSLFLYFLSATYLIKPWYQDEEPTKEELMKSSVTTRRLQIPGAFMIFWAIGFLILLKLEFSIAVVAYSMFAFGAPILWVGLRRSAKMAF